MFDVVQTTQPGHQVMTASQVRSFMQIQFDGEDDLLDSLIGAAAARIESLAGIRMLQREYRITSDNWPEQLYRRGYYSIPLAPVSSMSVDIDGEDAGSLFSFRVGMDASIRPASGVWPVVRSVRDGIRIGVTVGFGVSAQDVPQELLTATRMSVLQIYQERNGQNTSGMSTRIAELVSSWRRVQL